MAAPAAGAVVLVRFPFSDLTSSKLRPEAQWEVTEAVIRLLRAGLPGS